MRVCFQIVWYIGLKYLNGVILFQKDYVDADLNLPDEIEIQVDCHWERYQVLNLLSLKLLYLL
jgi:hypothetical protein